MHSKELLILPTEQFLNSNKSCFRPCRPYTILYCTCIETRRLAYNLSWFGLKFKSLKPKTMNAV